MIEAKEKEGVTEIYMKSLRFYLRLFADGFQTQLRSVTTSQLGEFLRNMEVSPRSKNNLRQTIGTFFKYCRELVQPTEAKKWFGIVPSDGAKLTVMSRSEVATHELAV